jgi:hypothetical protein
MGPPLYVLYIVDQNIVMWRILVLTYLMNGMLMSKLFPVTPYYCPITLCARNYQIVHVIFLCQYPSRSATLKYGRICLLHVWKWVS